MNNFSVRQNQNHPVIESKSTYLNIQKYVSIHSEDRNIEKYPDASMFEMELPQDYTNVSSVRLSSWSFPTNFDVFTVLKTNTDMSFQFVEIYNPADHAFVSTLESAIYAGLSEDISKEYIVTIEPGIYTPEQLAIELTNKFNETVTDFLNVFFATNPAYAAAIPLFTAGYTQFVVKYNSVGQKMWFGNKSSQFLITTESQFVDHALKYSCENKKVMLPNDHVWGLPPILGLPKADILADYSANPDTDVNSTIIDGIVVPKFYYEDSVSGLWLLPDLPGAQVFYIESPFKTNPIGPQFMYMEIDGLNCIDETSPYNASRFTATTNMTNSTVNSAFAKIPISTGSITQSRGNDSQSMPYKWFYPANERIRKLRVKFRYHDGSLVQFNNTNYTFMLEFTIHSPQRDLGNIQIN